VESESNYTHYITLDPSMTGRRTELIVIGLQSGEAEIKPEAWITAYPVPFEDRELILYE
jgi:hypothetical protein